MEAIKMALNKKADQILEQEMQDLNELIWKNKLASHINIMFQKWEVSDWDNKWKKEVIKKLYWTDWIFYFSEYWSWLWNSVINDYKEKRKEEIIRDILNWQEIRLKDEKEDLKACESKELSEHQIIINFLEKNITEYTGQITSTISAISHWHIQSNWTEIDIYKEIVSSLSFLKADYINNNNK